MVVILFKPNRHSYCAGKFKMLELGKLGGIKIFVEAIPDSAQGVFFKKEKPGISIQVVKSPGTPISFDDFRNRGFNQIELSILFSSRQEQMMHHFYPGHERIYFHRQKFEGGGDGDFFMEYKLTPI